MKTILRAGMVAVAAIVWSGLAWAQSTTTNSLPSDAEIRAILAERVDTHRQSVGIVAGVIDSSGRRIVTYGRAAASGAVPLDGDTVFEIGSISKVFTALLLSDAVARKEASLSDQVATHLPAVVTVPERGRAITLQDLAMHVSGLPRLPANMQPKDPLNPYADYSVEQLYQFLSGYQLPRDVGALYEYSNLGGGLLGHGPPAPARVVRSQFFAGCSARSWPGARCARMAGVNVMLVFVMPSGPVMRAFTSAS